MLTTNVIHVEMLPVKLQIFMQEMLSKLHIPLDHATKLYNTIKEQLANENTGNESDESDLTPSQELSEIIKKINKQIKAHDMYLEITQCEVTGNKYLSLIKIIDEDLKKLQPWNQQENLYWSCLMEEIIKSDDRCLNTIECMNVANNSNIHLKMEAVTILLKQLCETGYLVEKDQCYYLGSRAMAEFSSTLKNNFKSIVNKCGLCRNLCCYGEKCLKCNKYMHKHCLQIAINVRRKCPLCNATWRTNDLDATISDIGLPLANSSMVSTSTKSSRS